MQEQILNGSAENKQVLQTSQGGDWSLDEWGEWRYKGESGKIGLPGMQRLICDAAVAQGFWRGRELLMQKRLADYQLLSDHEFTALIDQHQPQTLPAEVAQGWRSGFILGWTLTWYFQPLLNLKREIFGDEEPDEVNLDEEE